MVLTWGHRRLPALSVLTDKGLLRQVQCPQAATHWRHAHTSTRTQTSRIGGWRGGKVHKHMFQGKHRRSEVAQACKFSAHADAPETPSNLLRRRASTPPPPNPLRRLCPAYQPSIHLAIDLDELTSDPFALLPHDSSASAQNPLDPLFCTPM